MKRYAILLGTEEYEENYVYPETRYCHDDVNLLKDTLVKYCDFEDRDIYVELLSIYEERTPTDILDKISEFIKDSKSGDTILFYYAGHGAYVDNHSYLILPHTKSKDIKQTAILLSDISARLKENGRVNVRIFDCCHSGQDVRGSHSEQLDSKNFTQDIISNNNDGWVTLASCSKSEKSYVDDTLKHGVFTYFLSESIIEYKENEDILPEIIKISLCKKVFKWCCEKGKQQTPTLNASISGNISIARRKDNVDLESKENKHIEEVLKETKVKYENKYTEEERKASKKIKDYTKGNEVNEPETLNGMNEYFKWKLPLEDLEETKKDIISFGNTLKRVPKNIRELLEIICDRVEEENSGWNVKYKVSVSEILEVCNIDNNYFRNIFSVISKYNLCFIEEDWDYIDKIYLGRGAYDNWWNDVIIYCREKNIKLSYIIVDLNFKLLD